MRTTHRTRAVIAALVLIPLFALGLAACDPAPVISGVNPSTSGATSELVYWNTDVLSSSQVLYGLTSAYGSSTPLDSTGRTAHLQNVTGLAPGTTYHYKVQSTTASSAMGSSADATFSTPPADTATGCGFNRSAASCWAGATGPPTGTSFTAVGSSSAPAQVRMYPGYWQVGNGTHQSYDAGIGTTSDPYVFAAKQVTGCIEVHTDNVAIRNDVIEFIGPGDVWTGLGIGDENSCKGGRPGDAYFCCAAPGATIDSNGRDETGSGDVLGNGAHGTHPLHGLILDHSRIIGHDTHIAVGGQEGWQISYLDMSGTLNGVFLIGTATYPMTVKHSYLHDVSALHATGCTGYNTGGPGCVDDYHRETAFGQYGEYIQISDAYMSIATTTAWSNLIGHSITGALFEGNTGGGDHWLIDHVWLDGAMEKGADVSFGATTVWQNLVFSADGSATANGAPCNAADWNAAAGSTSQYTGTVTAIDRSHYYNVTKLTAAGVSSAAGLC